MSEDRDWDANPPQTLEECCQMASEWQDVIGWLPKSYAGELHGIVEDSFKAGQRSLTAPLDRGAVQGGIGWGAWTAEEAATVKTKYQEIAQALTSLSRGRDAVIEECARAAENVKDGYSANIRVSEDEQELVRDPDGPWVLNSWCAKAIRALQGNPPEGGRETENLRGLVLALSDALTDEGPDWSNDGLQRLRARTARALPDVEWLQTYAEPASRER